MNPKFYTLAAVLCWLGTATAAFLEAYMLRLVSRFPGVEQFERNVRIIGVLLLVWLAVSAFFTVRAWKEKKK